MKDVYDMTSGLNYLALRSSRKRELEKEDIKNEIQDMQDDNNLYYGLAMAMGVCAILLSFAVCLLI